MLYVFVRRPLACRVSLVLVYYHASGILTPLSLLMLNIRVESSVNSPFHISRVPVVVSVNINFTSFHSGLCPVSLACSETAEFRVRANRISLTCSFLHGSTRFPNVNVSAFAWYLLDYTILLVWVSGIFRSDQLRL